MTIKRLNVIAHQVQLNELEFMGETVLNVTKDPSVLPFDEPTFGMVTNHPFHNGTIQVKVYSKFLNDAPDFARGFIGIAFRISENKDRFELIYVRPANGRCNDQVRRNHSTQYASYPNHKFDVLRKTEPEKYESYVDMGMEEWIDLKLVVQDDQALLYVNQSKEPVLIVQDLKMGKEAIGSIGLWTEVGTDAYFKDLEIS